MLHVLMVHQLIEPLFESLPYGCESGSVHLERYLRTHTTRHWVGVIRTCSLFMYCILCLGTLPVFGYYTRRGDTLSDSHPSTCNLSHE